MFHCTVIDVEFIAVTAVSSGGEGAVERI